MKGTKILTRNLRKKKSLQQKRRPVGGNKIGTFFLKYLFFAIVCFTLIVKRALFLLMTNSVSCPYNCYTFKSAFNLILWPKCHTLSSILVYYAIQLNLLLKLAVRLQ